MGNTAPNIVVIDIYVKSYTLIQSAMGLLEHIQAGAELIRKQVSFTTSYPDNSGSFTPDAAQMILGVTLEAPCRLRIYENASSLNNALESSRPFNIGVSGSVALVADISASEAGTYTIDPALFMITDDFETPEVFYRVDGPTTSIDVSLNTFLLEDGNITASAGTPYTTANKRTITINEDSVTPTEYRTGTIPSLNSPRTYLLISSSLTTASHETRLRLYSTEDSLTSDTELSRSFSAPTDTGSFLIADMIVTGSEVTYFSPKIVGANLSTMGTNLSLIQTNKNSIDGTSGIYYVLQNLTGTTQTIEQSIHIYSLED